MLNQSIINYYSKSVLLVFLIETRTNNAAVVVWRLKLTHSPTLHLILTVKARQESCAIAKMTARCALYK